MINITNFFQNIDPSRENEIFDEILNQNPVRIERIISYGQSNEEDFWYCQDENEWVIVLQGAAELEFEDGEILKMKTGDFVFLPRFKKHRVVSTLPDSATIWLAVFFREN